VSGPALRVNVPVLVGGLAIIGLFVALMIVGFAQDPRRLDTRVMEGSAAPDFALTTLTGESVRLSDLRGKRVVLNFWSTWCQPCKQEHPLLQQAPDLYPDVAFLGVLYQDDPTAARRYLDRQPVAYPQLVDPGGKAAIAFGVTGVPETFFIAPDGTIEHKVARALTPRDLALNLELAPR